MYIHTYTFILRPAHRSHRSTCFRPTFTSWDPLYISGMDKVRDFKFGVQIGRQAYKPKNAKVGRKQQKR